VNVQRLLPHLDGIEGICFDGYGTLVEITNRRHPYRTLVATLPLHLRTAFRDRIMREDRETGDWPTALGADVSPRLMERVDEAIRAEVASVRLCAGATAVLRHLSDAGMPIALCSNLASPYGPPLRGALPLRPDVECLSYELGLLKPEPEIYRRVIERLGVPAARILFIGDTQASDVDGPQRAGMRALHVADLSVVNSRTATSS
jgi:HAD superfamily hydrolase (TIGR01549 family)